MENISLGIKSIDDSKDLSDGLSTERTLKNIRKSLTLSLNRYGAGSEARVDALLKIHGLHPDNFDFVKNIGISMEESIADTSIDSNSNKYEKTIEGISQEVISPVKKLLGYDYLYRIIKSEYGKTEAYKLMGELLDFSLGLSDSTNILKPYCWSMDASKLLTIGRPMGQLKSKPCKRIASYVSNLSELVHHLSNHLAGAIAVGTFFLDIAHLALYKEGISIDSLRADEGIRGRLKNYYQQFVHSVNHLSRSNVESPFVNVSVFDREKLKTLINDENYGWYFSSDFGLNGDHETFVIEYIIEIQNIFLEFFDKGDPSADGMPYRFPVVTLNIGKDKENNVPDKKFLDYVTELDIYRYNIFTSEGTKVASCCRLISDSEMLGLASQSNSFGGSTVSLGSHRVVTVNMNRIALEAASVDDYHKILRERITSAGKVLAAHKKLLGILEKDGLQPFLTNKWIQMNRLFSTFGILGVYEADQTLRERFGIDEDAIYSTLSIMNDHVKKVSDELGIIGNIEQIPAESFAVRLAKADSIVFGSEAVPYRMYSNQFVPLWDDATIWEKMKMDGLYNSLITGGGIVHATIGERVTSVQARKIIEFSVKSGCEHLALNAIYSECAKGHTSFGKLEVCPICSKDIIDYYTRVVGFFVPVSAWNKTRRTWEFPNRHIIESNEG